MYSQFVKQNTERAGNTEKLKATDQIEWGRQMNAARAQVTEIVNNNLIYIWNKAELQLRFCIISAVFW